jgi:hypothetical protein
MKVIITKKHCENTTYSSCTDCALSRAVKEQYPEFGIISVAGDSVRNVVGRYKFYTGCNKTFDDLKYGWNSYIFEELMNGRIDKFELEIPVPYIDNKPQEQISKPKEIIRYVTISESLKEMAKENLIEEIKN